MIRHYTAKRWHVNRQAKHNQLNKKYQMMFVNICIYVICGYNSVSAGSRKPPITTESADSPLAYVDTEVDSLSAYDHISVHTGLLWYSINYLSVQKPRLQ